MSDFRYTPRTVGIIKLHARTMAPPTIATIMRCPASTIELICRKHGIEMRESDKIEPVPPPRDRLLKSRRVEIDIECLAFIVLANEARRRGIATRDLIAALIEGIADDHLFSAVLER
jgi:hypothetical protein